jgi:hypothetical protein
VPLKQMVSKTPSPESHCAGIEGGMSRLLWSHPESRADGRIRCVIINSKVRLAALR